MNESMQSPVALRVETAGELVLRVVGILFLIAAGFIEIIGLASNDPPPVGSLVFLILGGVFMIYGRLSQIARLLAEQRMAEVAKLSGHGPDRAIHPLHRLPA